MLLDVFDHGLAVHTSEGAQDELRMNGVSADHLAGNAKQVTNLFSRQISHFVNGIDVGEGDQVVLVQRDLGPIADKGLESGAKEGVETVVFRLNHLGKVRVEPIHILDRQRRGSFSFNEMFRLLWQK